MGAGEGLDPPTRGTGPGTGQVDLRAGEAVGPAVAAALASGREPLDQVWSPRFGWVLEPVVGRFSDSLLVSTWAAGRCRGRPGSSSSRWPGALGGGGGGGRAARRDSAVSVRARDLSSEDAEALLADLVARLEAGA